MGGRKVASLTRYPRWTEWLMNFLWNKVDMVKGFHEILGVVLYPTVRRRCNNLVGTIDAAKRAYNNRVWQISGTKWEEIGPKVGHSANTHRNKKSILGYVSGSGFKRRFSTSCDSDSLIKFLWVYDTSACLNIFPSVVISTINQAVSSGWWTWRYMKPSPRMDMGWSWRVS